MMTLIRTLIGNWKIIAIILVLGATFGAGAKVTSWRLTAKYEREEVTRQQEYQRRLKEKQDEVDALNVLTQQHEQELLGKLSNEQQQTEELRREINKRPVIRQVVNNPVVGAGGDLVCPPVPTVDWRVFRELYNRAASGDSTTDPSHSSDATLPSDSPYTP